MTGRPDVAATLPGSRPGAGGADEFGFSEKSGFRPGTFAGNPSIPLIPEDSEPASSVAGSPPPVGNDGESSNKPGRVQNRYTIMNADDSNAQSYMSALEEKSRLKQQMVDEEIRTASGSGVANLAATSAAAAASQNAGGRQLRPGWFSAEQEKKKQQDQARLYQQAKKVAEDTQSAAVQSLASVCIFHLNICRSSNAIRHWRRLDAIRFEFQHRVACLHFYLGPSSVCPYTPGAATSYLHSSYWSCGDKHNSLMAIS